MDGWGTPSLDVSARLDRPLRRDAPLNKLIVCGSVLAGDALALAIAAKAAFWGRFIGEDPPLEPYLMTFGGAALLLFLAFRRAGLYRFEVVASWPRWTGRLIAMVGAAAVLLIASLYLMKRGEDVSRVWLLTTFAGTAALMLLQRGLLALFVARRCRGAPSRARSQSSAPVCRAASSSSIYKPKVPCGSASSVCSTTAARGSRRRVARPSAAISACLKTMFGPAALTR